MKLADTITLARTKFKAKRLRNILTSSTVAISLFLILGFSVAAAGLLDTGTNVIRDPNFERYFAEDSYEFKQGPTVRAQSDDTYKKKYSQYEITNIFREEQFNSGFTLETLAGKPVEDIDMSGRLVATDFVFVNSTVQKASDFEATTGQPVPLVIPSDTVLRLEKASLDLSAAKRNELLRRVVPNYLGKTVTMKEQTSGFTAAPPFRNDPNKQPAPVKLEGVQFKVVGVAAQSYDFAIPLAAITQNEVLRTASKEAQHAVVSEFPTEAQRDKFVEEEGVGFFTDCSSGDCVGPQRNVFPRFSPLQEFGLFIHGARTAATFVGGLIGAIGAILVVLTVGRTLADSRKEIGVFRAIGAKRAQIRQIFLLYAALLMTRGFLLGLVMAVLGNIVISLKWGDDIFSGMILVGNNYTATKPMFITVGFPLLRLVTIYAVVLAVGMLAAFMPIWRAARVDPIKALRSE